LNSTTSQTLHLTLQDLDAILFDFDGVVVQSEDLYDVATQEIADKKLELAFPWNSVIACAGSLTRFSLMQSWM